VTPISVIIPVRNEGEKISRTVRSLIFGRSCRFPLEVVIVDDASIDGACNALPQLANGMPEVRIIVRRLNSWSGIPFARNRGAEAASYPIYLITDGNTCYPDKWDQPIRRNFQRGRVLTGTISDLSSPFFGYGCALMLPSMGVTWLPTPHTYGGYAPVATWTCTVIDQALFHHLGGYDETLSLYGAAEPEFSVRIWLSGYEIINIPDLLVQHQFQPKPEHDAFRTSLGKTLLSSYLRFACYYLPEQLLFKSYEYFSNLLTCDFDRCMEQIVSKGGWTRRAQLRQVLRYDFSWLLRKFCLGQPVTTAPASTKGRSAWVPVARKNDLLRTLVVIPTYGQHDLTRAVITDCLHEPVRVVVVDNKGDYQPSTNEKVIRPGSNFGWLRANNLAIETELAVYECSYISNKMFGVNNYFRGEKALLAERIANHNRLKSELAQATKRKEYLSELKSNVTEWWKKYQDNKNDTYSYQRYKYYYDKYYQEESSNPVITSAQEYNDLLDKNPTEVLKDGVRLKVMLALNNGFDLWGGAITTATTDRDGKFHVKLPHDGHYAFIAITSRQVYTKNERYIFYDKTLFSGAGKYSLEINNSSEVIGDYTKYWSEETKQETSDLDLLKGCLTWVMQGAYGLDEFKSINQP